MATIGGKKMERFLNQVTKTLPQLCGQSREIKSRLAESLRYRRNQIKNTKHWARASKLKKYQGIATKRTPPKNKSPQKNHSTTDVIEKTLSNHKPAGNDALCGQQQNNSDEEDDGFKFSAGQEVFVMNGTERLARVTFVRQSSKNDEYALVIMQSNYIVSTRALKLSGPNKQEFLHQIQNGMKFYWIMNQLVPHSHLPSSTLKSKQTKIKGPPKKKLKVSKQNSEKRIKESSDIVDTKTTNLNDSGIGDELNHSLQLTTVPDNTPTCHIKGHDNEDLFVGRWVAVAYNQTFYVGKVKSVDMANNEVTCDFLSKMAKAQNIYRWPRQNDTTSVNAKYVFCAKLNIQAVGKKFVLDNEPFIQALFQGYKNKYMS